MMRLRTITAFLTWLAIPLLPINLIRLLSWKHPDEQSEEFFESVVQQASLQFWVNVAAKYYAFLAVLLWFHWPTAVFGWVAAGVCEAIYLK